MKTFSGTAQLILRGFRQPQRTGAGAAASWTAAALRRFGTHAGPLKSARGLAQSKTWRRFECTPQDQSAFTMIEIAICLAIIGVGLVAIIGVLPIGMRTQRDNREETIINQDATVFTEAIRNGTRGLDDLTNYVYAITNYWTIYPSLVTGVNGYTYAGSSFPITNGVRIIGLLSTPEYAATNTFYPLGSIASGSYVSNHVVAYVRSLSGPAVEKPPQDNQIIQADAFAYRILCVNAPVATAMPPLWQPGSYSTGAQVLYNTPILMCWQATNNTSATDIPGESPDWVQLPYAPALIGALRELRLTFLWPQLPNGSLGAGRQTFRTMVAGQLTQISTNGQWLYFYQPQSFTNTVATQ